MSIGETDGNGVNHTPSGTDSGEENISEVLANAKPSDTREGFISHVPVIGECDCCTAKSIELHQCWAFGLETWACDECRGETA